MLFFNGCSTFGSLFLLTTTLLAAGSSAAPRRSRRSSVPAWHKPCGENLDTAVVTNPTDENFDEEAADGLRSIALQHQLTLTNYLNSDYDFLYERARLGVQKHQYIPNWIPGKKDVAIVKRLQNSGVREITRNLSKFHTDLQKFAVAFEELVEDERDEKIHTSLKSTQSYLLMTLCEVESVLSSLPSVEVPRRIGRNIMTVEQRNPVDETRRLIRDWGVLTKYKDYLHAWRHVFDY